MADWEQSAEHGEDFDEVDSADHNGGVLHHTLQQHLAAPYVLQSVRTAGQGTSGGLTHNRDNTGIDTTCSLPYNMKSNNTPTNHANDYGSRLNTVPGFAFQQQLNAYHQHSNNSLQVKPNNSLNNNERSYVDKTDRTPVVCPEHDTSNFQGARPKEQWRSWPGASSQGASASREYSHPLNTRLSYSESKLQSTQSLQMNPLKKMKEQNIQKGHSPSMKHSKYDFAPLSNSPLNKTEEIEFQSDSIDTTTTKRCKLVSGLGKLEQTYDEELIVSDCLPQKDESMSSNSSLESYIKGTLSMLNKKKTNSDHCETLNDFIESPRAKVLHKNSVSYDECDSRTLNNCKIDSDSDLHLENVITDGEQTNKSNVAEDSEHYSNVYDTPVLASISKPGNEDNSLVMKDPCESLDLLPCLHVPDTPNPSRAKHDFIKQPPRRKKYGIPIAPEYETAKARLQTFTDSKKAFIVPVEKMVDAGLYYTGEGDKTKCFVSGCGLFNWQAGDNPLSEHHRWFPTCKYAEIKTNDPDSLVEYEDCQAVKIAIDMGYSENHVRRAYNKCVLEGVNCPAAEKLLDVLFQLPRELSSEEENAGIINEAHGINADVMEEAQVAESDVEDIEDKECPAEAETPKVMEIDIQKQRDNIEECRKLEGKLEKLEKAFVCRSCSKKANMCNLPCGHITLCESCVYKNNRCIKCSTLIRGVVKIYVL